MTSSNVANFVGQCGECSDRGSYFSANCAVGLQLNQTATVNGNAPNMCVVANDGAAVFTIELVPVAGYYSYQVRVLAQGPSGAFSGSMYLAFQDMTTDVYYLSVDVASQEWHEVSFNSDAPAIQNIFWSDYSFTVPTPNSTRAKPSYKVVSPVDRQS